MNKSLNIDDKVFLTRMAEEVIARRLTTPSIFFFGNDETVKFCWKSSNDFFWTNN